MPEAESTPDFWLTSGYHLLARDAQGRLLPTEDFLRAYYLRPELAPPEEACAAERTLHAGLLEAPRQPVEEAELARLADADAAENWRLMLRWREHLLAHPSLEAAYLALARQGNPGFPPLFLDQLVQVILRGILANCRDPVWLRAAELLFRVQRVKLEGERVLLADEERLQLSGTGDVEFDLLDLERPHDYWARSDRFDLALDLSFPRAGLDAFCRVLEAWIRHFFGLTASIQPLTSVKDERWAWHIGLDAEASALLDALYRGETLPEARLRRLLSLFRLTFQDPAAVLPQVAGRPIYLGLAMNEAERLVVKPQNLLVNLPLARSA